MKKYLLILFFLAQAISSCAVPPLTPSEAPGRKTQAVISRATPDQSTIFSTPTLQPTINVAPIKRNDGEASRSMEKIVQSPCQEADPYIPDSFPLDDRVILREKSSFYTLDLKSGLSQEIKSEGYIRNIAASPDGRWLAYVFYKEIYNKDPREDWIMLEPVSSGSPDNRQMRRIPWDQSVGVNLYGWLNNQEMILVRERPGLYATVIVNIVTGEQTEFSLDHLPDVPKLLSPGSYYFANINVLPDPNLKFVVYPQWIDGKFIALRDQESKRILARIPDLEMFGHSPFWAVNGQDFIVAAATQSTDRNRIQDWFKVTRSGEVYQLTDFAKVLPFAVSYEAGRSPNGRYLAFELWYKTGSQNHQKWLILDLETQKPLDLCISADEDASWVLPVWSPDGRYLVLGIADENAENGKVFLVDILQNRVFQIAKDMIPVSWVSGDPYFYQSRHNP